MFHFVFPFQRLLTLYLSGSKIFVPSFDLDRTRIGPFWPELDLYNFGLVGSAWTRNWSGPE